MKPMELWIEGLEDRYWSIQGRLRGPINDSQICGDGFCAIGVLCDLFLKHAPEEAARSKARWEDGAFVWEQDGLEKKQRAENAVPSPVLAWWKKHHPLDLSGIIAANDFENRSFREMAMYLRGLAGMHYLVTK